MSDLNKLITDAQNYNKAIDDAEAVIVKRKPIPEIKDKR